MRDREASPAPGTPDARSNSLGGPLLLGRALPDTGRFPIVRVYRSSARSSTSTQYGLASRQSRSRSAELTRRAAPLRAGRQGGRGAGGEDFTAAASVAMNHESTHPDSIASLAMTSATVDFRVSPSPTRVWSGRRSDSPAWTTGRAADRGLERVRGGRRIDRGPADAAPLKSMAGHGRPSWHLGCAEFPALLSCARGDRFPKLFL